MRMVVADQNEAMRLGVRALFDRQDEPCHIHEARNRAELLARLEQERVDLVLLEPLMCAGTAETLIRLVRRTAPSANVLVYTDLDELQYGVRALRSGAKGYLMKRCTSAELVSAAARVSRGKVHISEALAEQFAISLWEGTAQLPHTTLSERESLVFAMLVCGRSVTDIARGLHLSAKTISTHKARALQKLRCRNLAEMVQYAIAHELKDEFETVCAGR